MSAEIVRIRLSAAAILGLLAGCESPGPANPLPSEDEKQEVVTALESAVEGRASAYELRMAGPRGRWEDVPDAVRWAIVEEGVEMGLIDTRAFPWGYIFELETVEDWPATLTVRATGDNRIYEATAEVGRFPDLLPEREERARALLEAFDNWMADLGAKEKPVRRLE